MLNASNAVENQEVSVCRLSDTNKEILVKALHIAHRFAVQSAGTNPVFQTLPETIEELNFKLKASKEIWLIDSK